MQPLAERLPTVLAPKTIDNDLGLNYPTSPTNGCASTSRRQARLSLSAAPSRSAVFDLDQMVNYVTPGYATAVFVSAQGVERIRTTAESHRRIAIIEVMGRHSGYIALGTAYGQPDIILVPEAAGGPRTAWSNGSSISTTCRRTWSSSAARASWTRQGRELGAEIESTDPAGNVVLTGAAEALRRDLIRTDRRPIFHQQAPQRIGQGSDLHPQSRPHPARRPADPVRPLLRRPARRPRRSTCLLEGRNNAVSILQCNARQGFHVDGYRRQPLPRPLGTDPRPLHAP